MSELSTCGPAWSQRTRLLRAVTSAYGFVACTLGAAQDPVSIAPTVDAGAAALRVMGALVFVLAVFFAGLWVFRNWQTLMVRRGRPARLRVVESRALGNRQALHVVKYRRQVMLVAASPAGVALLTEFGEEEPEEEVVNPPSPIEFPKLLTRALTPK